MTRCWSWGYCVTFATTFIIIFTLSVPLSTALNCDKVVQIKSRELFSYLGNVTFAVPNAFSGHWKLQMKTNVPFAFLGGWGVMIKEDGINGLAEFQNTQEQSLNAGDVISFRFRVSWAPRKPVPTVQKLLWQNQTICAGSSTLATTAVKTANSIRKKSLQRTFEFES